MRKVIRLFHGYVASFVLQCFVSESIFTIAFVVPARGLIRLQRRDPISELLLQPRQGQGDGNDNNNDNINDIRRFLESCWNSDTMGEIPTTAESAAESAAASILSAMDCEDVPSRIYFVDILLPQYDITQGSKIYDEILALDFCIALAKRLMGKTNIVVRDGKTLETVSRIFKAREGRDVTAKPKSFPTLLSAEPGEEQDTTKKSKDSYSKGIESATFRDTLSSSEEEIEFYSDFADFGFISNDSNVAPTFASSAIVDSFRESLISSLQKSAELEALSTEFYKDCYQASPDACYRVSSMLGNAKISKGPDMFDDVIKAVSQNAQPTDDENTIIILSAVTPEEAVGIRGLVGKYKGEKNIVMVNCQLQNIPRELIRAETVYSILPLIARSKGSSAISRKMDPDAPKVIVLRRYPRDWEVYVDWNEEGFKLAASMPANAMNRKKGPSIEWVSEVVRRYLKSI